MVLYLSWIPTCKMMFRIFKIKDALICNLCKSVWVKFREYRTCCKINAQAPCACIGVDVFCYVPLHNVPLYNKAPLTYVQMLIVVCLDFEILVLC